VSVFILRFSFHNSPLSLCFTSIAELCGSLEFRPALSHTVGAGLPPPFGPRRFFRRDRNTNTGIVKFRVVITPAVVILLRDFSGFQLSGTPARHEGADPNRQHAHRHQRSPPGDRSGHPHALLRAVLPVDRVAAVINAGSLIPVCLHEKAGAVNAPAVVCARADVRPA